MAALRKGVRKMATQVIPREQWSSFFDRLSEDHLEQNAALEVFDRAIGDQTVAEEQVFRGISADLKDGENRILIQLGPEVDDGTTHSISEPVEVWLKEGADRTEASLEIRAADGSTWLLQFAPSTLPA
jgi:hypothetical protein